MQNPIMQALNQRSQTNPATQGFTNNLRNFVGFLRNSGNPMGMLQNVAMQNPRVQQAMQAVNMMGGDPKNAFYTLAQQRGIDPNQAMNTVMGMFK